MKLIVLTAFIAVCGAAKLDRGYLPPASAQTAGGSDGDLSAPALRSSQNSQGLSVPKGGYSNEHQGIIVDAAAAGTRAAGPVETGLGGPRASYGSEASKVGDAAFRRAAGYRQQNAPSLEQPQGPQNGLEQGPLHVQNGQFSPVSTNQAFLPQSYEPQAPLNVRPQAAQDKQANIVRYDSEVGAESFNYAFETDNGIVAEENGVATNGVQAQGGFSYTSDDGQTYSVSYVADENGYQPKGAHLPTPPPIPEEILKSLEKNAQEAANGVVDDGSYDAKKYNGGDYAENVNDRYSNEQQNKGSGNEVDDSAIGSFVNPNVQQSEQPKPSVDVNQYLPGGQQQAQSQPSRSQQNNQQQNVGSQPQSYQSQAFQRQPIQSQQQQSYNNVQQSAQSQPAHPQWSQPNNHQQNIRPQTNQYQPQQQATQQPWSQQNNNPPQWSQSNNQQQSTRPQYQPQSQIPQQQGTPQPWSQQNSNKPQNTQPQNARPQNQQQPQIPQQGNGKESSNQLQNARPQYQPQLQSSQQQPTHQPWSQQNNQPENAQAQPEQPQWSQSNNQPQNVRPQSYQHSQLPQQQAPQQPWWQNNKNQPQPAQPQWSQANIQTQNARVQTNQQQPQGLPQWSQPKTTQASAQPWAQLNNNQPQGARPTLQQQPLSQKSQQQPQQQGNQQYISASASVNSGSNAFQSSYLPPRTSSQNIPARNPIFESTSQPAQQSIENEPAEIPAQIQQLPLTENQLVNENSAQGKYSEASTHVNIPPPTLAPSFTASAQASVNIGGQRPQYQGKPSYPKPPSLPASHADVEIESTQKPNNEDSAEQEEDDTIDVSKQDGPTAPVPNFINHGSQSSYEYSSQANHDQSQSTSAENQSSQSENPQGLYYYQQPQSYNNQPQITSSQASPTVSSEALSTPSQESSLATRYPKPPTLAPPTASAIPETESTSSAGASVENSKSSAPANKYLQPSNPSYPQQTDAIAKPFPQQQPFVQRQSIPQQSQPSQFGQRLRPQPQAYNQQLPQPSSTLQPSQPQQQPNYYQPQSSYVPPQANRRQPQIPQQSHNQQLPSQSPHLQGSQSLPQQISQKPQQPQPQQYNSYQQPISPPQQYQNVQKSTPSSYNQQEQVNSYQYNQPQQPLLETPQGPQSYQDQQPLNSYQQPLNYQPDALVLNKSEDSNIPLSPDAPAQQNGQELYQYSKPEEQSASNNDADNGNLAPQVAATGQPEEESNQPEILQTSDNSQEGNPDVKSPGQNQFAAASAGAPEQGYNSPVAGAGEVFDSQRQTPSSSYDDQTGYHY